MTTPTFSERYAWVPRNVARGLDGEYEPDLIVDYVGDDEDGLHDEWDA